MTLTDDQLTKVLTDLKYFNEHRLNKAIETAKLENSSLYDVLISDEYLTEDELGKVVAYFYQFPYVSLEKINIPDELLNLIPENVATKYQTLPYQLEKSGLHIATSTPDAKDLFEMLAKKAGTDDYHVAYTNENDIQSALNLFKRQLQDIMSDLVAQAEAGTLQIADLVNQIFEYAYEAFASDIHIEPLRDTTIIRYRIDGVLHDEANFPKTLHEQVVARIKIMSKLRTDEHLSAQDGRMRITIKGNEVGLRISIVPLVSGEKVVMRMLAHNNRRFNITELGMNKDDLDFVKEGFNKPYGMILSTGPTGSGKTTTIYAILKILNTRDRNIATIEDPIEYEIDGTNQIQANTKTNLTFGEGLRSLLRQDPDILFVGEIRDEETAGITVNAAMTGHLVLSTMHTNDAVTTLPRLVDMGIEPYLVASTVNIIIGQRLVRLICTHCKESVKLTKSTKGWTGDSSQTMLLDSLPKNMLIKHFGNKNVVRVYKGNGCSACHNTGYQGRAGIFEVLEVTPKMAQLISQKANTDILMDQAIKDGMITMLDDGLDKALNGETTLSEIMRVTNI
jgi:type II secretory ATPase GspE/PulE/Tfp pilus assembly ATPase PilB-like protein